MIKHIHRAFAVAPLMVALSIGPALAEGISTSFAEILVENLQIGRTYNTKDLIGLPLRVRNETTQVLDIDMGVLKPEAKTGKKGYEPIPSVSWVRLEKSTHTIRPAEEAVSNVFITIPRDKALMGRRFEVLLESRTLPPKKPGMALSVGIASRLIFTVSTVEGLPGGGDPAKVFSVMPQDLFLPGLPVGKKVHSGVQFGKSLTVFNPNNFSASYEIKSIPITGSQTKLRVGFEEAPDPNFIGAEEPVVTVAPHAEKTIFLTFEIPNEARYRGKNYMFLLETLQRTGTPRIKVYNRVYGFTEE